jgi:glycosyltransferase involved in cell wall biosynthesis/tRNA A-37 threonylcarbamoyl transferase component Bud32
MAAKRYKFEKWRWEFAKGAEETLKDLARHWEDLKIYPDIETLKSSPSRTVLSVPPKVSRPALIIKRYHVRGSTERLKYFFFPSRAAREWIVLRHLRKAGVAVPKPLGFGEARSGRILLGAGLVMERSLNAKRISDWLRRMPVGNADRLEVIRQVACQVARLHDSGCRHNDLHAGNILVCEAPAKKKPWIVLIDHHACRIGPMPTERQRRKNLGKLFHSLLPKIAQSEALEFLRAYGQSTVAKSWDAEGVQRMYGRLTEEARRLQKVRLRSRSKRCWKNSSQFARTKSAGWHIYRRREVPLAALRAFQREGVNAKASGGDRYGIFRRDASLELEGGAARSVVLEVQSYGGFWRCVWRCFIPGPLQKAWGSARVHEVEGIAAPKALALMVKYQYRFPVQAILITERSLGRNPSRHSAPRSRERSFPKTNPHHRCYTIARVITWLPRGGIERRLVTLLPKLNRPPFRVKLVCIRERGPLADELEDAGVAVSVVHLPSRLHPRGLWALAKWMRDQKIDLLHSHMYRSNVPATIAARLGGIHHVVCQVHNIDTWETWRQRILDRWLLRWRTTMLAVSKDVKRDIIRNLHCPEERITVLYNGIDIRKYGSVLPEPRLRGALNIPENYRVVVMLARLVEQKQHTKFLQVLEQIRRELPPTRVLLVGEGKLQGALEHEVKQRGLHDMVLFTGHRNDIPQILALSDLSVLTSDKEGFSNAIIESLAAGVPVVATDVGGNSEAVVDGECGFIVAPDDLKGLARAITKLLVGDTLRHRMSEAARRRADLFSIDHMVQETHRLYLGILEKGVRTPLC